MARTRAQDYEAKRSAILRRSAELFARHGYSATSITMIAEACGASKALLYYYYQDKEALLFDVIAVHLSALVEAVEKAARESEAGDRLYAVSAALLEAYWDADAEHQVQIASLKMLQAEMQEALRTTERKLVALFSDLVADAVPAVGRGPLLKPLTMSLFGMLNWHYLWFREGKGLTRPEYARLATGLITAGAPRVVQDAERSAPAERTDRPRDANRPVGARRAEAGACPAARRRIAP